jgi:hypothetical protein
VVHRLIGPSDPAGGTVYFAYGANLDRAHMARTAPRATALGPAVLPDHRLAIGAAGYATLVPAAGAEVHGLLWHLTGDDERRLDEFEAVPTGFYRKRRIAVRAVTGEPVDAMVYLAADARPGHPVPGYLERILRSAEALGFPAAYREAIAALAGGPDRRRSGRPD